jgi:hypothetical protein
MVEMVPEVFEVSPALIVAAGAELVENRPASPSLE